MIADCAPKFVEVSFGLTNHWVRKSSYLRNQCPRLRMGWRQQTRDELDGAAMPATSVSGGEAVRADGR